MRDPKLMDIRQRVKKAKGPMHFNLSRNGILLHKDYRLIRIDSAIKTKILAKVHTIPYFVHLGSTKMYRDLKKMF